VRDVLSTTTHPRKAAAQHAPAHSYARTQPHLTDQGWGWTERTTQNTQPTSRSHAHFLTRSRLRSLWQQCILFTGGHIAPLQVLAWGGRGRKDTTRTLPSMDLSRVLSFSVSTSAPAAFRMAVTSAAEGLDLPPRVARRYAATYFIFGCRFLEARSKSAGTAWPEAKAARARHHQHASMAQSDHAGGALPVLPAGIGVTGAYL
jgi:hypothetical protein